MTAELPDHAIKTIEDFESKLGDLERQMNALKTSVNMLCEMYGTPPKYEIAQFSGAGAQGGGAKTLTFRPDEFFNKPLATCVREILMARKLKDLGPADPQELFQALRSGGFAFESRDEDVAFRGMQISISKNTERFNRLPNGQIGLAEWYPASKRVQLRRRRVLDTGETPPVETDAQNESDIEDPNEL